MSAVIINCGVLSMFPLGSSVLEDFETKNRSVDHHIKYGALLRTRLGDTNLPGYSS